MRNLFFSVLLLFSTSNFAQRVCGTMDYQHMLEQHDHKVAEQRMAIEQFTSQYIANNLNSNNSNRAVITIPFVVHVVYNTAVQNISAAQNQTQIDVLNRDFAKLNSDTTKIPAVWKSLAANTNIQFCLAKRDPNGNATTGITRTSTTTTSFSTNNAVQGGKLHNKKNTFTDFIAVAESLSKGGMVDSKRIFAMGRSAGGLLMGAIANMRPDLFKGIVAGVPFVDVVTTMLDESIPLTTFDYEEWGNPAEPGDYEYVELFAL